MKYLNRLYFWLKCVAMNLDMLGGTVMAFVPIMGWDWKHDPRYSISGCAGMLEAAQFRFGIACAWVIEEFPYIGKWRLFGPGHCLRARKICMQVDTADGGFGG